MKIILIILSVVIISCGSTPKVIEENVVENVKPQVSSSSIPKDSIANKTLSAINEAEMSMKIANQVIPFRNKFNPVIRNKVDEAADCMAEARKSYIAGDYIMSQSMSVRAKKLSDESLQIFKSAIDKDNEKKRLMVESKILEGKKQGKDTFEAENYLQQKNYDDALQSINRIVKSRKRISEKEMKIVMNDCLWDIAIQVYDDGFKWRLIYNANKDSIKNPNKIFPGQVLSIPSL